MKKKIYDILKENNLIRQEEGVEVVSYYDEENGIRHQKTYKFLSYFAQGVKVDIQHVDYYSMQEKKVTGSTKVGMRCALSLRELQEAKMVGFDIIEKTQDKVITGICIKILVEHRQPHTPLYLWEDRRPDGEIVVNGVCGLE